MQIAGPGILERTLFAAVARVADAVVAEVAAIVFTRSSERARARARLVPVDGELGGRELHVVRLVTAGSPLAVAPEVVVVAEYRRLYFELLLPVALLRRRVRRRPLGGRVDAVTVCIAEPHPRILLRLGRLDGDVGEFGTSHIGVTDRRAPISGCDYALG